MSTYFWLKWLHVLSSTVLFGTGAGIAFFFLRANRTGDVKVIAAVARDVVVADLAFTATAVAIQPVTGVELAHIAGYPFESHWLLTSIALYCLVGCFWLPVVWLQIRMRNLAIASAIAGTSLPARYFRYYRWWFELGWPAFIGALVIFYLMVARPSF
jgi:uncharacterized membrane protein